MPSNNPLINPTHVGMNDKTKQYRIVMPWSWIKTKDGHDISNEPKRGGKGGGSWTEHFPGRLWRWTTPDIAQFAGKKQIGCQ